MSYIKTKDTYSYSDGEGGLIINTNHVIKQEPLAHVGKESCYYAYVVHLPPSEFHELVFEILKRVKPDWASDEYVQKLQADFELRETLP